MRRLKDLKLGARLHGDCGSDPMVKPPWLDAESFRRGQQFFRDHILSFILALPIVLVTGMSIINLLEALVFTGRSGAPVKAFKRYFSTFMHLCKWHYEDVWDGPNGTGFRSVMKVRQMHRCVAKCMNGKHKQVKTERGSWVSGLQGKDSELERIAIKDKGEHLYVSQYDMSLVQCGFFAPMIMYPRKFGLRCTQKNLEDYVHFWAGMGYLLGIKDEYNVCINGFDEALHISKEVEQQILIPAMKNTPEKFHSMAKAFTDGSNLISKLSLSSVASVMALAYWGFDMGVPRLSFVDWLRFWHIRVIALLVYWLPGFELVMGYFARRKVRRFMNMDLQEMWKTLKISPG